MGLTHDQMEEVKAAVNHGLTMAEKNWAKVGEKFASVRADSLMAESAKTRSIIPGHQFVEEGKPEVSNFISIMIDMRGSTSKLALDTEELTGFQRVYYETSALLPAIYTVSSFYNGTVTEYLGDGALVLHKFTDDNQLSDIALSALNYVNDMRRIINLSLSEKYQLPPIDLGVGVSCGPAMVTLVGHENNMQAKAIGKCVWESSKLCCGKNKLYISQAVYEKWPRSPNGLIRFKRMRADELRGVHGYYIRS